MDKNHYSISNRTTGEFDLVVDVHVLDDEGESIDVVYEADSESEARNWIEQQGGILREAQCVHCGNVQADLWGACAVCGCGALVATDRITERFKFLQSVQDKIKNSITNHTGRADRALDLKIEQFLVQSSIHSDHLSRNPESAREVTSDISATIKLVNEALPEWDIELFIKGVHDGRRTANATLTPPAKPGEFRHHSQEPEDIGGVIGDGTNASLAMLNALFQVLIAREVGQ